MEAQFTLEPELQMRLSQEAAMRGQDTQAFLRVLVDNALDNLPPPPTPKPRVAGLHAGQGWISDDFDDPLPDSFWLGEGDALDDDA